MLSRAVRALWVQRMYSTDQCCAYPMQILEQRSSPARTWVASAPQIQEDENYCQTDTGSCGERWDGVLAPHQREARRKSLLTRPIALQTPWTLGHAGRALSRYVAWSCVACCVVWRRVAWGVPGRPSRRDVRYIDNTTTRRRLAAASPYVAMPLTALTGLSMPPPCSSPWARSFRSSARAPLAGALLCDPILRL